MLHSPPLRTSLRAAALASLTLPLAYLALALISNDRLRDDFVTERSEYRGERGDEVTWVYTRLAVDDRRFRQAALTHVAQRRPESDMNVEDVAVFFTDSLDTAKGIGSASVLATLCMYEDGTPDRWGGEETDCFDHESFHDRMARLRGEVAGDIPHTVANYLISRQLCADFEVSGAHRDGLAQQAFCRGFDGAAMRAKLEVEFAPEQLRVWLQPFIRSAPM